MSDETWTMPNEIFDLLDEFMDPIGGLCRPSTTDLRAAIGAFVQVLDEHRLFLDPSVTRVEVPCYECEECERCRYVGETGDCVFGEDNCLAQGPKLITVAEQEPTQDAGDTAGIFCGDAGCLTVGNVTAKREGE